MNPAWITIIIIFYFSALVYLGIKGFRQTSNSSDYLVIAGATVMFFGFCTATFLPSYTAAIFWSKTTRKSIIVSSITGFITMLALFIFICERTAPVFRISAALWGDGYFLPGAFHMMDPLVIAPPVSSIALIFTAFFTEDDVPAITQRLFDNRKA